VTRRRVLSTGVSGGIGRSVAEQLAMAGHRPVGVARTVPEMLSEDTGFITGRTLRGDGGGSPAAA